MTVRLPESRQTPVIPLCSGEKTSLDKGESPYKANSTQPGLVRDAIEQAGSPRCSRFSGYWLVGSPGALVAVPLRCRSRKCPHCSILRGLADRLTLLKALDLAPGRVRLVTLTDATGTMTNDEMSRAFQRLAARLRRRGWLGDYYRVIEWTKSGALHYHLVIFETEKGGGFIPQAELSVMAEGCGFGRIADIEEVQNVGGGRRSIADYLTKGMRHEQADRLGGYLTKTARELIRPDVADKFGARFRPVTLSQGFLGGTLRESEQEICRYFAERQAASNGLQVAPEAWEIWHESDPRLGAVALMRPSLARALPSLPHVIRLPDLAVAGDRAPPMAA